MGPTRVITAPYSTAHVRGFWVNEVLAFLELAFRRLFSVYSVVLARGFTLLLLDPLLSSLPPIPLILFE